MLEFDLHKQYGTFHLDIAARLERDWLVLLAPSGAGKSLTLNLLSGLVRPDSGFATLDGEVLCDVAGRTHRPIRKRHIGYLFQDYALFPHLTVAQNIAYGLPRGARRKAVVAGWAEAFRLTGREHAYPRQLSGGQRQRVALARTLASEPRMLLLDEPFSALDRPTRGLLQMEMAALKERLSLPVILVTHDFVEAQLLGDRVAVLQEGSVLEMGDKDWIFAHPKRHETAVFLGVNNVLPARVAQALPRGRSAVEAGGLRLTLGADARFDVGAPCYVCMHAADVRLLLDGSPRANAVDVDVISIRPEGGSNRVRVRTRVEHGPTLEMLLDDYVISRYGILAGQSVRVHLPEDKLFLCR